MAEPMTGGIVASVLWLLFTLAIVVFLATPMLLVILFSFNQSALTSLPLTGLTLDWYRRLFANDSFWPALQNSLIVGFSVALVSVVTGTLAALALARMRQRHAAIAMNLLSVPMMIPALIIGIALLSTFVRLLDLPLSLGTVILGHLLIAQHFVVLIVYARLSTFDWATVESARDLGASPLTAFRTITLPIIQPTIVGAGLIALSISLDDFVITFFTIGGGNTLPTLVWGLVRTSLDPTINAMATLLIVLSIGSTILALRLSRYRG
jgi:spermidine/putrescine transport system permease protein